MMKSPALLALFLSATALGACVGTPAAYEARAVKADDHAKGYLGRDALQALADAVPAPPSAGSPEESADHTVSASYNVFENTDRWLLATSHAEVRMPFALQHFDCVLGVRFNPAENAAPATARLMQRLFEDAEGASTIVKLRAYRARPVGDDADRLACQTVSAAGRASASYPSGTATVAAAYGAAMAAIAPDSAVAAQEIGRQIALSRAVCGMHYPTDVRVGYALGQKVFEQAARSPAFADDLAAARAELAVLRAQNVTNPGCAAERGALAMTADLQL